MSKTSFENIDTDIPVPPVGNLPAEAASSSVVTDDFFNNSSGFEGEIERKDIRTPYLALAHGVGGLSKLGFSPGSIIFNQEIEIARPTKGVMEATNGANITVLAGYKEYIENVSNDEFNAGVKARRFKTEAEARAVGLMLGKEARAINDESAKTFYPAVQAKILVRGKPEDGFAFEFEGNSYALAALALGKMSYWGAGVTLLTFANEMKMLKRPNYWASFQLFSKLDPIKGTANSVWSLKAQKSGKHSDAFVNWIKEMSF